jgi:hypothetical protein
MLSAILFPRHFRAREALPRRVRSRAAAFNLPILFGAGNGTRTRDPELGRLALYQLSYSRIFFSLPSTPLRSAYRSHPFIFPSPFEGEGGAPAPGEVGACGAASPASRLYFQSVPPPHALILHYVWWRGEDSNLRRRSPSDLQSDPFGHSGTSPPNR